MITLSANVKAAGDIQMKINKFAFYILSFTWGLPLTLIGCFVAGALICLGHKPKKFGYCYYFEVGEDWGGLELGIFFLMDKLKNDEIAIHEFGHGIQNCLYGFFMIPLVCIPSAIRYWYREFLWKYNRNKYFTLSPYNAIWFEGQATRWGHKNTSEEII